MKTWRALFLPMVLLSACSIAVPPREAFESDAAEQDVADAALADGSDDATATDGNDTAGLDAQTDATADTSGADADTTGADTETAGADAATDGADAATDVADAATDGADVAPDETDTAPMELCANVSCPDLACATQTCDAATGKCVATAKVDGWPCDDGKKCTADDACLGGVCTGGAKNCDDGNACTNDSCNASLGCVNTVVMAGTTCDDGDACTMGDVCVGTTCVGKAKLFGATFGDTSWDQFLDVAAASDGYIATGFSFTSNSVDSGLSDLWIVKTDFSGAPQWKKLYGGVGSGKGYAALPVSDGIVAVGANYLKGLANTDGWILKTDPAGGFLWEKKLGGNANDAFYDVVADGDGFVAVGQTTIGIPQVGRAWAMRFDATGTKTWEQAYPSAATRQFNAVAGNGDGFVAVGTSSAAPGDSRAWLARLDNNGNLLWERTYGSGPSDSAAGVVLLNDGFAIGGTTASKGSGGTDFWLIRTDLSGNVLWDRTYGGVDNDRLASIAGIGNDFVLSGDFAVGAVASAHVVRTDSLGNTLFSTGLSAGMGAHALVDNGSLLLAGHTPKANSTDDGWLARTDLWGNATCTDSGACAGFTSDCDDGNACTADLCAKGTCSHVNLADTAPCGSGDACKVGETCTAGSCSGGGAKLFDQAVVGIASMTGAAALAVGSGGFTISATTKGGSNGVPRLVHTDAAGVVTWDKTYALGSYAGQVAALIGTGEGYALAGSVASDNNAENPFLIVTDGGGVAKVNVELGTSADEWIAGLAQTGDGYLLAGKSGAAPGAHELLLIHTDALGAQLWQKTYGGAGLHAATAVAALADGAILAGWSQAAGATPQAWLLRTDAAGGQVWSVLLGATVADGHNALAVVNDGFVITGNTPGSGDLTLTRTDSTGTVLWTRSYPGLTTARAIVALNDGFIVTGGATTGYQLRTDNDGNVLWQQTSSAANDGGVALADGFAFSAATSGGLHLTRTDLWGNASCSASGTCAGLSLYDCDDSNPCTADLCDADHVGCWHANMADGLACGYGATCGAGVCKCEPGYLSVTTGEGKVCAADVPVWGNLPYSPANMTDNGNSTVTDGSTGLTWQQADPGGLSYSWSAANQFCIDQKLAGYSDWRLPTLAELNTLIDFNKVNPATPNLLQTNVNLPYWSATPLANAANNAWSVSFVLGTQQAGQLTSNNHVRCVRGTTATPPTPRFTAANGIVTDAWTGLMWQQDFSPSISAAASTTYCGALLVNGVTAWRIPNVVELRTLIDRSVSGPAIDSTLFPATPSEWFWASSGAGGSSADFWSVYFSEGLSEGNGKANTFRVRCVK